MNGKRCTLKNMGALIGRLVYAAKRHGSLYNFYISPLALPPYLYASYIRESSASAIIAYLPIAKDERGGGVFPLPSLGFGEALVSAEAVSCRFIAFSPPVEAAVNTISSYGRIPEFIGTFPAALPEFIITPPCLSISP